MNLWTNDPLVAARHIYLSRGFRLVRDEPHHSFGADMVGQYYELELPKAGQAANRRSWAAGRRPRSPMLACYERCRVR